MLIYLFIFLYSFVFFSHLISFFHNFYFQFLSTLYRLTVRFYSECQVHVLSSLLFVNVQELFLMINMNNDKQLLN